MERDTNHSFRNRKAFQISEAKASKIPISIPWMLKILQRQGVHETWI